MPEKKGMTAEEYAKKHKQWTKDSRKPRALSSLANAQAGLDQYLDTIQNCLGAYLPEDYEKRLLIGYSSMNTFLSDLKQKIEADERVTRGETK
jgi:hypothetical protein